LLLLLRFVVPVIAPEAMLVAILGGLVCALAVAVWWAFFSRAPRVERFGGVLLMIVALALTPQILHESIRTGMMGMMFFLYAIPVVGLAFAAWAVACRGLAAAPRRAAMVASVLLACGAWALVRTDGILGAGGSQFAWRWSPTPEERLLAQAGDEPPAPPVAARGETPEVAALPSDSSAVSAKSATGEGPAALPAAPLGKAGEPQPQRLDAKLAIKPGDVTAVLPEGMVRGAAPVGEEPVDWPGFRGAHRDGIVRGLRIETDWSKSPPAELWRRPVGPGWSSFAVHGDLLYTQEQRGDDEVVACYNLTTGEPVWRHRDAARFWESNAGAGPRGTPTLSKGRLYALGGTGIVNALDARGGAVVWSRNAAVDSGEKVPYWGFSGSPLVVGDEVIVAASGRLVAYDLASGEPRWRGPEGGGVSYSSPHPATIDGVAQILLLNEAGATSVAVVDGAVLWKHEWSGFTSLQPALTADGAVLITTSAASGGLGTRRLAVLHPSGGWTVEERWTSEGLKPYFNDFVVHQGHAYGFDGRILSCIDLAEGQRKWKGGRYGNGQLVLLADQDLLLVLSDEGDVALVAAAPNQFTEVARFAAIQGKTWNHPAVAGDVLLVRNDQEMAAFRLARARE
jgi:outer membrane protein assembly factor BamB